MFLGEFMKKCSGGIGAVAAEYLDIQQIYRVEIDSSVEPVPLCSDLDSGFVDRDPRRLRRRRVSLAVGQPMRPLPNRLM